MRYSIEFEKQYHAVLALILSKLEDLPPDVLWEQSLICLSSVDLFGIDANLLPDITKRLTKEKLIETADFQKALPNVALENHLGAKPSTVGVSDIQIWPLVFRVTDWFETEAPETLAAWKDKNKKILMEAATKITINYSPETGFVREDGGISRSYTIEHGSKRYHIVKVLCGLTEPVSAQKLNGLLPENRRGNNDQISKDVRDIKKLFKSELHVNNPMIKNGRGQRGYKLNKDDFLFIGF